MKKPIEFDLFVPHGKTHEKKEIEWFFYYFDHIDLNNNETTFNHLYLN